MENNSMKSGENQGSASHNKGNQQYKINNDNRQEEQSHNNRTNKSGQEGSSDKYLSNGYLDDKERYDDSEL